MSNTIIDYIRIKYGSISAMATTHHRSRQRVWAALHTKHPHRKTLQWFSVVLGLKLDTIKELWPR